MRCWLFNHHTAADHQQCLPAELCTDTCTCMCILAFPKVRLQGQNLKLKIQLGSALQAFTGSVSQALCSVRKAYGSCYNCRAESATHTKSGQPWQGAWVIPAEPLGFGVYLNPSPQGLLQAFARVASSLHPSHMEDLADDYLAYYTL